MKKFLFPLMALLAMVLVSCEENGKNVEKVGFDDFELPESGVWNGSDGSGGFTIGNATFNNNYNADWGTWSGFAVSNHANDSTPGFANQYSVIAGSGANGSEKFIVYYPGFSGDSIQFAVPEKITNISVCNTTYTYFSIKDGDAFSRKFEDGDWFLLQIHAFDEMGNETVFDVYLADFRDGKSEIVDYWKDVDLSSAGFISKLKFSLSSTDNGEWGMNTPAYVCLDNIKGKIADE